MRVDDLLESIYDTLCAGQKAHGPGFSMSLDELATTLGLPRHQVKEAVMVARLSDDLYLTFVTPARDRVRLSRSWQSRCAEDTGTAH